MQKNQIIKGNTIEEKIKSIERVLWNYKARLSTKVIGIIPPIPIFENLEVVGEDGIVTQKLFPLSGTIIRACMAIREYEGTGSVMFTIASQGVEKGSSSTFETRKHLLIEDIGLIVEVGDLVTLRVDSPERVRGVFLGILFEVGMKDVKKEEFLIDQFLNLSKKEGEENAFLDKETNT